MEILLTGIKFYVYLVKNLEWTSSLNSASGINEIKQRELELL